MRKQQKISVTVSPDLVDNLDYISSRVGVSRSALISELLSPGVTHLRHQLEQIPAEPTHKDILRYRGESAKAIREQLDQLERIGNDLLSGA